MKPTVININIDKLTDSIIVNHPDEIHNEEPRLYHSKSYQARFAKVEAANGSPASPGIETEMERCRLRLLRQEYKRVEQVVLELKGTCKKPSKIREEYLLKALPRHAENLLNTLLVLGYLPLEQ